VWAASVGFFAFLPVVSKTEAMLHPENLNLLCAAAAVASATTMLVRKRRSAALLACLAGSIILGLATRASTVFVVLALVLGFAVALGDTFLRRSLRARRIGVSIAVIAVIGSIGLSYAKVHQHRIDSEASRAQFFNISLSHVFANPWRPHMVNQALTTTYADLWGDWFGAFSWSVYSGEPAPAAQRLLKDQSLIGVLPTVLAIAGWLGLVWLTFRRGRRELAVLALLPLVATVGYLARSWLALTKDGDLFKATYLVNTAPVWALCFGLASAWLATRSRLARYGMIVLFATFAVLELRFMLYGIRANHPVF
jgi:hypothetical protein